MLGKHSMSVPSAPLHNVDLRSYFISITNLSVCEMCVGLRNVFHIPNDTLDVDWLCDLHFCSFVKYTRPQSVPFVILSFRKVLHCDPFANFCGLHSRILPSNPIHHSVDLEGGKNSHCNLGHVHYFSISRLGLTSFLLIESFVQYLLTTKAFINEASLLNLLLNNIKAQWSLLNGCSHLHRFAATN